MRVAFLFFISTIAGCTRQDGVADEENTRTSSTECFAYTSATDTITLRLQTEGVRITGELIYNFNEKDDNKGTLTGRLERDTLIADYTFRSEGTESVREVVFIRDGDVLHEAYGEMVDHDGRLVFRDVSDLMVDGNVRLQRTACDQSR